MNVCTSRLTESKRLKVRDLVAFGVPCPSEQKIVDIKSGSKILKTYVALRTFMQNNPTLERKLNKQRFKRFLWTLE